MIFGMLVSRAKIISIGDMMPIYCILLYAISWKHIGLNIGNISRNVGQMRTTQHSSHILPIF